MSDKNNKDGKIGSIEKSSGARSINATQSIQEIEPTKKTGAVQKVSGIGSSDSRRKTVFMSAEERAELFKMIEEEAGKLLKNGSAEQKELIEQAVKMAVDGGILEE